MLGWNKLEIKMLFLLKLSPAKLKHISRLENPLKKNPHTEIDVGTKCGV